MMCGFLGSLARWFTYSNEMPELMFLDPLFFSPMFTIFWVVWLSMLGDFCDFDEYKHGKRREGITNAISGWVMKAGSSITFIGIGYLLNWTGFDVKLEGNQSEETLDQMRMVFVLFPAAMLGVGILLNAIYPLSRARMEKIREELEERRGTV